jgi:quercetin dioxygenase-like cupin family protein
MGANEIESNKADEVQRVGELLHYQAGSIVSKVLLKNKGGTVTLFAFSKGEALSEHTAPFDALVQIIEGEADVSIAYDRFQVRVGEIIKLPANIPHAIGATSDFKMLLTMIRESIT